MTVAIVVAVMVVLLVAAADTVRGYARFGDAYRAARRRKAEEDAKAERLHRRTHPDESAGPT